ncbi:TetR/AcrR family transcriptional regulator [Rhodococcus sp. BP-252]|uniref:SACE_7040 family transcriptional regulator n=1 Tax=unclassified Rhodococcus (in: high G+C Gram-positive bacteria) TaxID=192944 RepID=UPI001C9BA31F|nr:MULTISPECIES: TetR/AcrR family transcriptional regulator [unclassified Rhodococcus (in: high G+C Gram-positive bacteria)]MBY6410366.1 TetR/AcrR family transcriptional regulator [Rhodococcus sp. BP-320]MBY6416248.1 TetR/AcrR family transcriptional regulator [Rhodococcus sp. BP-321]MBY6420243.1 TetR/AcrR family transcriptional regulator [Rhodococcus sp. BP-324]MBY6424922.1 TetR/AcrR family transcriptional regulator [Rhodococcus sp. BP-323]MBY6430372.1 TetR/AcrR family transcriptional regulato
MATPTDPGLEDKPATSRDQKKAERREQLLQAAASLFAERGFSSVRLEDLGAAVGISGPAVYRHFSGKEAVLVELLVGISQYLLDGGRAVVDEHAPSDATVERLIDFHLDFAFASPALIRIQDRDLESLPETPRRSVRRKQREYVELWVSALCDADATLGESDARTKAHAVFGLINSTPYSAGRSPSKQTRPLLRDMVFGALRLD